MNSKPNIARLFHYSSSSLSIVRNVKLCEFSLTRFASKRIVNGVFLQPSTLFYFLILTSLCTPCVRPVPDLFHLPRWWKFNSWAIAQSKTIFFRLEILDRNRYCNACPTRKEIKTRGWNFGYWKRSGGIFKFRILNLEVHKSRGNYRFLLSRAFHGFPGDINIHVPSV